jgi:predicted TIM-barrel fold metal-dependent hydrolase
VYPTAIFLLTARKGGATALPEVQEAHREMWHGLHDPVLRIADMDREGVAAEMIFHGDFRLGDLFHNATSSRYPIEAWAAGARAWNRWAADNFAFALDRFLPVAAVGPCVDMDQTVKDLAWVADHGFVGTYGPNFMRHVDTPELYDSYWDPLWSVCAERGLAIVVHAGYGWEQGIAIKHLERIVNDVAVAAGSRDPAALYAHADALPTESAEFFTEFASSIRPRRPLWQMMLGGVFDRHPNLKLMLTEIRLDWIPATLRHLDALYDEHRADLPATRKPSEYWRTNCMAGASFIHKAEVGMRHELGVETISFGRDYPHPEGTWPNTRDWLRDAFVDVPDDELRLMLGENVVRFLGRDRDRLAEIARRIGPTIADIKGSPVEVRPELIESFASRGGYLKPAEGEARLASVDELIQQDLAAIG